MVQGRLSSSLTGFYKYALVPLWIVIYGYPTVRILIQGPFALAEHLSPFTTWLIWGLWSLITVWLLYFAVRLKSVRAYVDSLRVTSLSREIVIHRSQLVRADQLLFMNPPIVRLFYVSSIGVEKTVWFMPKFRPRTGRIADENLVADLNAFAERASTSAA